jgi:putative DNA primase/helicase
MSAPRSVSNLDADRVAVIRAETPWQDPGPIAHVPQAEPYPIEVFPPVAREAILEYHAYGKRPLPMLADACLAQMALAYEIATGWPSAALVSDEAGLVLGSRGMSDETALGFLTLLNRLWDGRPFLPLRKQAKTAEIRGRRFSCSLMLQHALLKTIAKKGAQGVGFFGRYLMTAPPSTMGTRLYSAPPADMPALAAFNARIRNLLSQELPVANHRFELRPPVLMADKAARGAWIAYHDAVELEVGDFGEYAMVREVAAKSAENAARVAGVFRVFAQGVGDSLERS